MTNSINLKGFTVTMRAQGVVKEIALTDFHADTIDAILTYGTRRWFQDHINSQAKLARDNGDDIDADELFDARLAQAVSGEITVRAASDADPLDAYRIRVVRGWLRGEGNAAKKLKAAYTAIPSDDQKARKDFLLAIAAKNAEHVESVAAEMRERELAKRAAVADLDIAI